MQEKGRIEGGEREENRKGDSQIEGRGRGERYWRRRGDMVKKRRERKLWGGKLMEGTEKVSGEGWEREGKGRRSRKEGSRRGEGRERLIWGGRRGGVMDGREEERERDGRRRGKG